MIKNEKMCQIFKYELIKSTQLDLQKCITWSIKFRKGKQKWNNACENYNIFPRKLNIIIKTSKFIHLNHVYNHLDFLFK